MTTCPPVVREYIKNFVMNLLSGMRDSEQMADKYQPLSQMVKRATTLQLDAIAIKVTNCLVRKARTADALSSISQSLIHECLERAVENDGT